jgi:hypothetical protein
MEVQDIKPDLMVHAMPVDTPGVAMQGAAGIHVGTVDHLEGDSFIKLKKSDSKDGRHHWIPIEWVKDVDDKAVYLTKTAEEVEQQQLDEIPKILH